MRIPVYPQDLIRNRGFKSLSKQLQKQWCGPTPISLANAQAALAQGLGYQNFHDLEKISKICPLGQPVPPEADVRQAIGSAIKATLQPEALLSVDQRELEQLVTDLPLTNLGDWYEWRRLKVLQTQPNGAYRAIAELAKHVPKLTVLTHNVDGVH